MGLYNRQSHWSGLREVRKLRTVAAVWGTGERDLRMLMAGRTHSKEIGRMDSIGLRKLLVVEGD